VLPLFCCVCRQGDYGAALPLAEQAVQLRAAALGQVHPEVASAAHNLGVCHSQLGQTQAALDAHLQALAVRQQLAAEDQSSSATAAMTTSCRAVAACLARLGRHEEASQQLATVLDAARSAVADVLLHGVPPLSQHRIHSVVSSTRGGGSGGNGSMQACEDEGAGGGGSADMTGEQQQCLLAVAAAAEELGKCYSHQGQHARAEELYWEAMEAAVAVLGSRSDTVHRLEGALRECLTCQLNRC
jgi:tetratricopeptide (TPR) repeat protein